MASATRRARQWSEPARVSTTVVVPSRDVDTSEVVTPHMAEVLVFNGVDAVSGRYLLPAMAPAEISAAARGGLPETDDLKELRWWHHRATEKTFGPKEGIDARQLSQ